MVIWSGLISFSFYILSLPLFTRLLASQAHQLSLEMSIYICFDHETYFYLEFTS